MAFHLNNLAFRSCRLLLLALFLVPCIACGDVGMPMMAGCLPDTTAVAAQADGHLHIDRAAPECACLSDAGKLRGDAPIWMPVIAVSLLPAFSWNLPEPQIVPARFESPDPPLPSLLASEAISDRAPPAV